MTTTLPNSYTNGGIDRADRLRADASWVAARLDDPATKVVPTWRLQVLATDGDEPRAAFVSTSDARGNEGPDGYVLLGVADGDAYFAVDVSHLEDPAAALRVGDGAAFAELRRVGPELPPRDASLLALARAMAHWHSRHRYCGVCGSATSSERAGYLRVCTNQACATQHFPRTDPAVITLVTHGDACLLGRQSRWRPGQFSVLAGFVEPGESLEETVVREVLEESGVLVGDVAYHSSQPWPFPSSLMVGFRAVAIDPTIAPDGDELEEVRWFTRGEIHRRVAEGTMHLSPKDSISRRLIDEWLAEAE